ncbi:MAG: hypothetical protein G5Z42_04270 [Caldisphaeraceae archaeon]|nr:hypothetical protein [Caldisphaeraceae archaeon]MEB3691632.1 hypothetical protein [Caldisphaeraceae archaeon]MEB3798021.1 hypothetical protein [Caldisphaeraceae archaeon]
MADNCRNSKLIKILADLSRLEFSNEERNRICEDLSKIQEFLKEVSKLSSLSVKPLYNVWDGYLEPREFAKTEEVSIEELAGLERIAGDKVKIKWRGG